MWRNLTLQRLWQGGPGRQFMVFGWYLALAGGLAPVRASDAGASFHTEIEPLLVKYCHDCHGEGMDKGKVAFDQFKSDEELLGRHDLWLAVLKNVRAGLMPPEKKPRPSAEEFQRLEQWIKREAFGLDPEHPDPGQVTLRRLNRVEYRNTIQDLMGFDFKVEEELPPDDTGYGFDNIGDVLTMSPLLLEKYMQAAEHIVVGAVPRVAWVVREQELAGDTFRRVGEIERRGRDSTRFTFYEGIQLERGFTANHTGHYRLVLDFDVLGEFDFDPGRCRLTFKVDGNELWTRDLGWANNKKFRQDFELEWPDGEHQLALELHPLTPVEDKKNSLDLRFNAVRIEGPLAKEHWVRPRNFERFFTQDPPEDATERRDYARSVMQRFVDRTYRRPVGAGTVDRLVAIAEDAYGRPGKRFEDGIAQAMIPVLASPRFLFRVEESLPNDPVHAEAASSDAESRLTRGAASASAPIDEFSLASRLSYFLWSTLPDEELFGLARRGELRRQFAAQLQRMLADDRSQALIENFVGQWLQTRDIDGIDVNARAVLARDAGEERNARETRMRFRALADKAELTPEEQEELEQLRLQFRRRGRNRPTVELDRDLRRALRRETEMLFEHVLREDRPVLELIDSDYTFVNERLARHYGIPDVQGGEMRRVPLPPDHPRGGLLTQGSILIVTSNPTRTSPVKRGLFVLENILGSPPPPPPADVPLLEEAEKEFEGREPSLREVLELHRSKPLCRACHNRMDPLGLALENFNALGMWREKERGQAIDSGGALLTGETFNGIRELKRILTEKHRRSFYTCLTEKLLTYALGRGLEYYDVETVDQIVARLEKEDGRFSALLMGVVESAPFQRRRTPEAPKPIEQRAELKPL